MQPQSDPRLVLLLKYPPLTLLVVGQLETGTLFRYSLLIDQCQFRLLGMHYNRTVQLIHPTTIGEGCSCPLILSFLPRSSIYETLQF